MKPVTAKPTAPAESDPGVVQGRVVMPHGNVIRGLRVSIGEQSILTDAEGRFVFHNVRANYDLAIADPDGRRVTTYFGLTRRDPIVGHTASNAGDGVSESVSKPHHATVMGSFRVNQPIPDSSVAPEKIYFFSSSAFVQANSFHREPSQGRSPYGPVLVDWAGDSVTNGTLLALTPGEADAYLATVPIALADGDTLYQDLRLAPIATGQIAGLAQPFGLLAHPASVELSYAVPGTVGVIDLGKCEYSASGAFDCHVPDLTALGGEYCVSITPESGRVRANRCGGKIGMKDFSIPPGPPQPVLACADAVSMTGDMVWWSGPEPSLYQLNIGSCSEGSCAVAYLTSRSFTWFDFQALHMRYHPGVRKGVTVSALYPYTAVDELAGGSGPLGRRATWQRVDSNKAEMEMLDLPGEAPSTRRRQRFGLGDAAKLLACSPTSEVQPLRDIGSMVETRVSVRGILTGSGWSCTMKGCVGGGKCCVNDCWAHWILEATDAKTGVLGLLQGMESRGKIGANECHLPKLPRVEVIASGVLVPDRDYRYSLDDVSLCAVRPSSPPNER